MKKLLLILTLSLISSLNGMEKNCGQPICDNGGFSSNVHISLDALKEAEIIMHETSENVIYEATLPNGLIIICTYDKISGAIFCEEENIGWRKGSFDNPIEIFNLMKREYDARHN